MAESAPKRNSLDRIGVAIFGLVIVFLLARAALTPKDDRPAATPTPAPASVPYEQIAKDALTAAKLPQPTAVEIDGTRLIVTFQREFPSERAAQAFAESALMTIRNAAYQKGKINFYRVTLNGPPPGPGMIRRIGSARLSEGGSVNWEYGK